MALIRLNNQSISSVTALPSAIPTGKVLQIVQSVKTDSQTTTSTSYADITGLSINITPSSSSSKVLIMASMGIVTNSAANGTMVRIVKDGSYLVRATTSGNAQNYEAFMTGGGSVASDANRHKHSHTLVYLDSPATTSSINYKLQFTIDGGSTTGYINRWGNDGNHAAVSTITAYEIAN